MGISRSNDAKIIGILLEDIGSDFSKELVKGVKNSIPAGRNIRLVVLPGKHIDVSDSDWQTSYKRVYNSVFSFAKLCDFDGFIIHLGSMNERDKNKSLMYRDDGTGFADKPKVFVASDMRDCITVNYDNETGIREAVEYLVNVHGVTKFCMLGGRDDNKDARARKAIFTCCLAEYGLSFRERNFVHTDMTVDCLKAARKLLDQNPDTEAVFCVNDAVAKGLYTAMNERGLVPGKDIQVFGFDNTKMSGELIPQLTSIGSDKVTLGQKALELLLDMLSGEKTRSATVQTRLYGRDSLQYETYDYDVAELFDQPPEFIYKMFDECFYRYKHEQVSRENVDLRRLFFEIISRLLLAMKRRYMSEETFAEIIMMIDKFFEKNAIEYTDANKLLRSIERLQNRMNANQTSMAASVKINRLFLRMKDMAICSLAEKNSLQKSEGQRFMSDMQRFLTASSLRGERDDIFRCFDMLGIKSSALYVYDEPVFFGEDGSVKFPEHIMLKCVLRSKDLYIPTKERQRCTLNTMFARNELTFRTGGIAAFPVFCGSRIYGMLLCCLTDDIYDIGEYAASLLGRSMRICEK